MASGAVAGKSDSTRAHSPCGSALIAAKGHPLGEHVVGLVYAEGRGVQQEDAQAAKWFRNAAEQGMPLAQGKIGLMYAKGQGVPQNNVLAHKWISLFAALGDTRSESTAEALDFLASEMTPAQLAEAQRRNKYVDEFLVGLRRMPEPHEVPAKPTPGRLPMRPIRGPRTPARPHPPARRPATPAGERTWRIVSAVCRFLSARAHASGTWT